MTDLAKAANEAAEALKGCEKSRTGIVISKIADSYGVDRSTLGRELYRRSQNTKKEKKQVSKKEEPTGKNMPLNYLRIEQLVKERGFTINDFAEICGKSRGYFDDVREGRTRLVRATTYTEFARKLGVPVEEIILKDGQQMTLVPEVSHRGQQEEVDEKEAAVRAEEGRTQGRKGCKASRINMAFTTSNFEFVKIMSAATGQTMTKLVNFIIKTYRAEHPDFMEKAKAFVELVNSSPFFSLLFEEGVE